MNEMIPPPADAVARTHCTSEDYERLYRESLDSPETFWAREAQRLDWTTFPTRIANWSYEPVDATGLIAAEVAQRFAAFRRNASPAG